MELRDGKIWIKKREEPLKNKPFYDIYDNTMKVDYEWRPFGKTGLPRGFGFSGPKKITSIEADGDTLIAIDEKGFVYRYGHRFGYEGKPESPLKYRRWSHKWGAPFRGPLKLPPHLAWSVGRNNYESLYHVDTAGNKINFGKLGLTHIYALPPDGRNIQYADTGLPPDFSRSFCGPKRGNFQAINMSASGIVIFLINRSGEMYTKLVDYDTFGGTPFYKYYYGPGKKIDLPVTHAKAMHIPRRLPLPDWKKQPPIQGDITKKITIILTGNGPSKRELRVEGRDLLGRYGYFHKMIHASKWRFTETGLFIDSESFLKNKDAETVLPKKEIYFKGNLKKNLALEYGIRKIEIPDFHFSCSPMKFNVFLENKSFSLTLHTVDSWTHYPLKDPNLDNSSFKRMKGTLEIPANLLNSKDLEIQKVIREIFLPYHLKTFKWAMVANQNLLKIQTGPLPDMRKGLSFSFMRKNAKSIITSFSDLAKSPSLLLKKGESILRAIDRNADQRKRIVKRRKKIKMRLKGTEFFYKSLNPFQKWFGNKNSDEEIGNVLENITDHYFVLKETSQMADNLALKHSINDYYVSLEIIEKRICNYFNLLLKEKKVTNYFKMGPIRKRRIVGKRVSLFKNCPHKP